MLSTGMPCFYLNVYNDEVVIDQDGVELQDLATAQARATEGIRSIIAEHVTFGRPVTLSHRVEITDDNDDVLSVIRFGDVLTIID